MVYDHTGLVIKSATIEVGGDTWSLIQSMRIWDITTTDVVYYSGGQALAAGDYLLRYKAGAVDYDGGGGVPAENYVVLAGWGPAFGCGYEMGPYIVHSGGTEQKAAGDNLNYATIAACETANLNATTTFTTTSADQIGIYIKDCFPSDNVGSEYIYELYRKV